MVMNDVLMHDIEYNIGNNNDDDNAGSLSGCCHVLLPLFIRPDK